MIVATEIRRSIDRAFVVEDQVSRRIRAIPRLLPCINTLEAVQQIFGPDAVFQRKLEDCAVVVLTANLSYTI